MRFLHRGALPFSSPLPGASVSPRSPSFTKHGKQSAAELPRLVYVAAEWLINISLALGRRHIQARLRSPSVSPLSPPPPPRDGGPKLECETRKGGETLLVALTLAENL